MIAEVGDLVSVSFPLEPVLPYAGATVSAVVRALCASDEYPYRIEWTTKDDRVLSRMIQADWIVAITTEPKRLDRSKTEERKTRVQRAFPGMFR
jgi:hypothetical protein